MADTAPPPFQRLTDDVDPWCQVPAWNPPVLDTEGQVDLHGYDIDAVLHLPWGSKVPPFVRRGIAELVCCLLPRIHCLCDDAHRARSAAGRAHSYMDYLAQLTAAHSDELRTRVEALELAFTHLSRRSAETEENFAEVDRRFGSFPDHSRVVSYFDEVDRRFRGAAADVSHLAAQVDHLGRDLMLLGAAHKLGQRQGEGEPGPRTPRPTPSPMADLEVKIASAHARAFSARGTPDLLPLLEPDLPLPVLAPSGLSTPGAPFAILPGMGPL